MSKTDKKAKQTIKSKVRVLYQNLGGIWYAFADMGDDVFVGRVNSRDVTAKAEMSAPRKTNNKNAG
jgi:hypothetical protein